MSQAPEDELKLKLTGYTKPGQDLFRNVLFDQLVASIPKDPQIKVQIYNAEIAPGGYTKAHELLGARLRAARLRSGLGLRELSRQLDISASSVSQIELGRLVPSVSTLYALTNVLKVSMDSLFAAEASNGAATAEVGDLKEGGLVAPAKRRPGAGV